MYSLQTVTLMFLYWIKSVSAVSRARPRPLIINVYNYVPDNSRPMYCALEVESEYCYAKIRVPLSPL